ncbi:MAG TPA: LemA family protein [Clostridiales bacterium]|nr:LemA family protein [Clostridiales bacterium]
MTKKWRFVQMPFFRGSICYDSSEKIGISRKHEVKGKHMPYIIASGMMIVSLIVWIRSKQRRFAGMDKNINNAMTQIGVQISSKWDVLISLLDTTKTHDENEYTVIKEMIRERHFITENSTPAHVIAQLNIIDEAQKKIMAVAESYPDLKADNTYDKILNNLNQYEKMIFTSQLIYNDRVAKRNHVIHMFPASIAAVILGFYNRTYKEI